MFPPVLDIHFYRDSYSDLVGLSDEELVEHFIVHGQFEGRQSNSLLPREEFAQLSLLLA